MPIRIPNNLPAVDVLHSENIFVMTQDRASSQDIRPLEILLVNPMPKKIDTEIQFSRLLGNTSLPHLLGFAGWTVLPRSCKQASPAPKAVWRLSAPGGI